MCICLSVQIDICGNWVVKICIQLVISTMGGRNDEKLRHLQTSLAGLQQEMKRNTYWKKKTLQSQLLWSVLCNMLHLWVIVLKVCIWSLVMMYRYSLGLMQRHAKIRLKGILIIAMPKHYASSWVFNYS